jgi:hypothetical protein
MAVRACIGSPGRPTAHAVNACDGVEVPRTNPGNCGQVAGAASIGVVPDEALAIVIVIAQ